MKRKALIISSILCISLFSSVVASAAGFFTSWDSIKNNFNMGTINGTITEEFEEPDIWNGDSIDKKVSITNDSNVDVFVRVSFQARWTDEEGKPWSGDTNIVDLIFNEDNLTDTAFDNDGNVISDKWIADGEGYYYYSTVLKPGDETNKILGAVKINEEKFKALANTEAYYGKELEVDVRSEVVQAAHGAYKSTWDITNESISELLENLDRK